MSDSELSEIIIQELEMRGLLPGVDAIAEKYNLLIGELVGRSRTKRVTAGRHACWQLLRKKGFSFPEIASIWKVHHTSVLEAVRKSK